MADFSFKDDDANPQTASAPESASSTSASTRAATPNAVPSPPLPPLPASQNAGRSQNVTSQGAPSPPLPVAPRAPQAPGQNASTRVAASGAARPNTPVAGTQSPKVTRPQAAPTVATGAPAHNQAQAPVPEKNEGPPLWRRYLDRIEPIASWVATASIVASALFTLYLLYAVFSGGIAGTNGNMADVADLIGKISLGLCIALIALALSLIVLMFDWSLLGPSLAVLGFALFFGAAPAVKAIGHTHATGAMAWQIINAGQWLLALGLLKYSLNIAAWLAELPNRMRRGASVGIANLAEPAQQRAARQATMFSPCWQLPFCREVIRKQCPAYLARKRCWKFGRGCYCDEEMISRIIRGENSDIVKAPTRMSRQGKPPCGRCYIFLEHQSLKYKSLAWLAIPATAATAFFGWPIYTRFFSLGASTASTLWARLSFSKVAGAGSQVLQQLPAQNDMNQYRLSDAQMLAAAQGMFGVLLGFFLLIYISKFIEWAIYKAKW